MPPRFNVYDVIIVGAGPIGVLAANLMGARGLRVLVLDREKDVLNIPRAIGLDDEGARILQSAGLINEIRKGLPRIKAICLNAPKQGTLLTMNCGTWHNGFPRLQMIKQPDVERILRKGLERFSDVDLCSETECIDFQDQGGHMEVSVRRPEAELRIRARFLLGCDGSRSFVRERLGVKMSGCTYEQDWLVVDVNKDPIPGRLVEFILDPKRPGVTMPAPEGGRRWEFMLQPGDDPEYIQSSEALQELLHAWGDASRMQVERQAIYTFQARVASDFRKGNVFLAGDAAHLTPPFAGQGLMAGFRDVFNLSWKLAASIQGRCSDALIHSYDKERRGNVHSMVNLARILGFIVMPGTRFGLGLRALVLRLMGRSDYFTEMKAKPVNQIRKGFLAQSGARAGELLPQGTVKLQNGDYTLMDDVLGQGWALLGSGFDPALELTLEEQETWRKLGGRFLCLSQSSEIEPLRNPDTLVLEDVTGIYTRLKSSGRVLLLRPDRHVYGDFSRRRLSAEMSRFFELLTPEAGFAWT